MIDTKELENDIMKSGLKRKAIARELGITTAGLSKKIRNLSEFRASEIEKLTKTLGWTRERRDQIFFNHNSDLKSTKGG